MLALLPAAVGVAARRQQVADRALEQVAAAQDGEVVAVAGDGLHKARVGVEAADL